MLKLAAVAVASLAVALALPAAAHAASPNDNWESAIELGPGGSDLQITTSNGTQPGEPLADCGQAVSATAWYAVQLGDSGKVTVTTSGSGYDTVVSVYGPEDGLGIPGGDFYDCNDDVSSSDATSAVTITGDPGDWFDVQVGGCCGNASGVLFFAVSSDNDDRRAAQAVGLQQTVGGDNTAATVEPGERLSCGDSDYGSTVWFRFSVPEQGEVVLNTSSTNMDPVTAVYAGSSTDQVGCNDDAPGQSRSSRLVLSDLAPGDYRVQVGGYYDGDTVAEGDFELRADFAVDVDLDNDGANQPQDCDDRNAGIRPGLPEALNNDVDENCDGIKEFDRDGDGSRVPGNPADCDDANPARSPLKPEVAGNRVDENCDGRAEPFPVIASRVSASWDLGRTTRMLTLSVFNARKGSTVALRCRGKGCGFSRKSFKVRKNAKELRLQRRLTKRQRRFGPKAKLTIRLSAPGTSAKETIYTMRPRKVPARAEYCITDARRKC
jgi:hypothetical protein